MTLVLGVFLGLEVDEGVATGFDANENAVEAVGASLGDADCFAIDATVWI